MMLRCYSFWQLLIPTCDDNYYALVQCESLSSASLQFSTALSPYSSDHTAGYHDILHQTANASPPSIKQSSWTTMWCSLLLPPDITQASSSVLIHSSRHIVQVDDHVHYELFEELFLFWFWLMISQIRRDSLMLRHASIFHMITTTIFVPTIVLMPYFLIQLKSDSVKIKQWS